MKLFWKGIENLEVHKLSSHQTLPISNPKHTAHYLAHCSRPLVCDTLYVPLDHQNPTGTRIKLAFAVHYAQKNPSQAPTLWVNFGGSGIGAIARLRHYIQPKRPLIPQKILDHFNIIALDPRGTGGSDFSQIFQGKLSHAQLLQRSQSAAPYINTQTFI